MPKKDNRFEKIYSQGSISGVEILVDKETGVNYIFGFKIPIHNCFIISTKVCN